jgi:predicted GIY-YIG superfamily endonuclease
MEIVYTEEYSTHAEARKREVQIKKMKSRQFIENLILKGRSSQF